MRLSPRLCFGWSKLPRREWTRLGPSRHGCGRGRPWRDRCIQPPQGQAAGWGRTSPRLAAGTLASLFFAILALALVVSVKTAVVNWFMSSTQAKKWAMSSLNRVHVAIDRATAKVKYQFPFISSSHPFSSKEWASERPDCFSYSAWVDSQNMSRIYLSLLFYESASSDDYEPIISTWSDGSATKDGLQMYWICEMATATRAPVLYFLRAHHIIYWICENYSLRSKI